MIAAHSLGTLVSYDFFRHDPAAANLLEGGIYLTFGSQINNDFARSRIFPGPIQVPKVRSVHHLFNDRDPVTGDADTTFQSAFSPDKYAFRRLEYSPVALPSAEPGYLDHAKCTDRYVECDRRPD